jgi:hypothetical protein
MQLVKIVLYIRNRDTLSALYVGICKINSSEQRILELER